MKILVLNPPVFKERFSRDGRCQSEENTWLDTFPPTTFASIAGQLRTRFDTYLIDSIGSRLSFQKTMQKIANIKPDYLVMNTSTPTIQSDLKVAGKIKKHFGSKIFLYGEHVTARGKEILKEYPHVDFIVQGDPETPIFNICSGKKHVVGILTRDFDGGQHKEEDLDVLAIPAYDMLPPYYYPMTKERWMFVRSGKGCPYNCSYCVMPKLGQHKVRYHSPEYMVRQFKWMADELDIKVWMLWDELSTFDKSRMLRLCTLIKKAGLHKYCKWFCTTRVDRFDEELAKAMSSAGCRMISFGFESQDQHVLDRNRKGTTIKQNIKAAKIARKYKMNIIGHFILGLPGSTAKKDMKTIRFAKKSKINYAQFYVATPFPESDFYEEAKKNGWFDAKDWKEVEQGTVVISYPGYSAEEIRKMRRRAYREFYLRPFMFVNILKNVSFKVMVRLPLLVFNFSKWMRK